MSKRNRIVATNARSYKKQRLPSLFIVGVVCALLISLCGNVLIAYAESQPGGNVADPVIRAVDIAKPSVVRILTVVNSHLIVHFAQGNDVAFPQSNAANANNANGYGLVLSGSGTFITSKGDILTADHVVNPPQDQSLLQFLNSAAAQDVANYINQNNKSAITPDQVTQELNSGQLKSTASFDKPQSQVFLSTDYTGPQSAANLSQVPSNLQAPVDVIEKESAVNQKDVAIVHANFGFDTPSVELGDSSNVQQQDTLTIIGFPGNGDVSNKPTDLLTSSVNKINVSSIKTTDNGAPVIQVGGNVEHGDSGGPALDTNGNVVGIVSFGLSDPGSPGGTSFLQASNSARDLVQMLNLNTAQGNFQKLWNSAFQDYAANTSGHWHKARQEFQQLATSYPQFKALTPYLNYATTQAQAETTVQPGAKSTPTTPAASSQSTQFSLSALALTIGIILVLVLLVVVLFAMALRPRKQVTQPKDLARGQVTSTAVTQANAGPSIVPGLPLAASDDAGMAAFGAPGQGAITPPPPVQAALPAPGVPLPPPINSTSTTLSLRVWPCGHMNRPNARFCSICGELAPPPPQQRRQPEQ